MLEGVCFFYSTNKSQTIREVLSLSLYTARWCNSIITVYIPGVLPINYRPSPFPCPLLHFRQQRPPFKDGPHRKNSDDLSQVILWAMKLFRIFDEKYKSWSPPFLMAKLKKNDYNFPRSFGSVTIRVLFPNMDCVVAQAPSRPLTAEALI